jgi:roadblock/LC7 domain-containing protein
MEDQVGQKRCGHRPGKEVVTKEEMVDRVKAAVDARTDAGFVIMARTDAAAVEGWTARSSAPFKPKKSVALSGVAAGNTALCTVGRTGNDLHYRGYDILDFADTCEFEEIAHLLVHGKLPNAPNWPATRPSSRPCAACPPR